MRNYLKFAVCGAIVLLTFISCGNNKESKGAKQSSARFCTPQTARILGRVYVKANPLSDHSDIVALVQQYSEHFMEGSPVINCATSLGNRLVMQGLSSFSQNDYNRAYGRSLELGATMEQARDIGNSISSGSVDLFIMGKEMLWLAQVLPYAARGDWGPFQNTGSEVRTQVRQILPIYNMMLQMDPAMAQMVNEIMRQFEPIAEEQIVMLALMSGA